MLGQPFQRMLEDRQVCSAILGKLRRAQERRLGAVFARDGGDLFVIGRDDHPRDGFSREARLDAVGNQGVPGKVLDILARDALGTAPGRDDRQHFRLYHAVHPPSTITLPPVM